jgi:hypothetical protein
MVNQILNVLHDGNQIVLNLDSPRSTPACSFETESFGLGKRPLHKVPADMDIPFGRSALCLSTQAI